MEEQEIQLLNDYFKSTSGKVPNNQELNDLYEQYLYDPDMQKNIKLGI